jgi:glycosyltransferase involved in cell wall biosynthesis
MGTSLVSWDSSPGNLVQVCVDIQPAVGQRTGVGRYTRCLVEHLGAFRGDDALALFYVDFRRRGQPVNAPGADVRTLRLCPGRWLQGAWRVLHWPPFDALAGPADVYHFPNFTRPPLRRGRSVVTVHDMGFIRYPECAESGNQRFLADAMPRTVREADAVITVSRFTAEEVQALLGVNSERVHPVLLGVRAEPLAPEAGAAVRRRLGLDRPYLLSVGTLEPRKNHAFLVAVFERLREFDGDLVLAGMRGWKYEPILRRLRASPRADHIRYLEFVSDTDLAALYAGAEAFVTCSVYEGFGLPPLEAMAHGTPVVSSRAGSLPEVLGDAAVLVDGFDLDVWTGTLTALLANTDRRRDLSARGRTRAAAFTWEATARNTWAVYRQVAS